MCFRMWLTVLFGSNGISYTISTQSVCACVCVCVYMHVHTHTYFTIWKSWSGKRNTKIWQRCQWVTLEHAKHRLSLSAVCSKHILMKWCSRNSLWNIVLLECILNRRPNTAEVSEQFLSVKAEVLCMWHRVEWWTAADVSAYLHLGQLS